MSDMIDKAQYQSELILAREIKIAQAHTKNAVSAIHCTDCGEVIPETRRQMMIGCIRCVACQSDFEKAQKQVSR